MQVTIESALELIYTKVTKTSLKILPIEEALGMVLAEDIIATHNLPPYDNSAMDGYSVRLEDAGRCVSASETIFAGDDFRGELKAGNAIKIMTGAKIPKGCEAIVPIEDTQECSGGVLLPKELTKNKHIRFSGEDIKKETLLLAKEERINAHQITLLASQGISHIKVYKRPRIALFASGNELKMHFEQIESYQLYNTNTPTLLARATELGCDVEFIGTAHDSLEDIQEHIKSALESDLIVTSGGVSVGDADFTKEAFGAFGYEIYFDKVDIKPGKPTTFGKVGDTFILNLPGNPLAAALNFELFGSAIIFALSGAEAKYTTPITAKMRENYPLKAGRRSLIPGFFDGEFFTPCEVYAPGMISPLAFANGFIMVDESTAILEQNQSVKVISTKFSLYSKTPKSLITY